MMDLAVLALYLAAVMAVGWIGGRARDLSDYVLAGRQLTLPFFVATLVPSFYGGVLGIGEFTWSNGVSNWLAMAAPYYVFSAVYALFFAGRVRLEPGLTIPDHLENAYGRPMALAAATLVFLLASPADEFLMIGSLLSHFLGWSLAASMAVGGAVALLLLLRGGLRSDARANALQFVVMFGGFAIIIPFAWRALGSPAALATSLPPGHLSAMGSMTPLRLMSWWLIAVWTIVDPVFHQRSAAAKDPRTARAGILVCIGFWFVFDAMTTLAGLYARAALPELDSPVMAFPKLADRFLPAGARGLFFAGLASSILAGLQGQALQGSIVLGKDGLGRWLNADDRLKERLAKAALVAGAVLAYFLALAIPSVVGLWYAIGSAVIPALLWPLVGVYYPHLRPSSRAALAGCLCSFALSAGWVAAGQVLGRLPFNIDPMFPGLLLSTGIWAASLSPGRRSGRAG